MAFVIGLVRLGFSLGALAGAVLAMAGLAGFLTPVLDVINHVQPLLLAGLIIVLLLIPFILPDGMWRGFMLTVCGLGFLASAFIVVPETTMTFWPRAALPSDGRPMLKLMTHNLFGMNYRMDEVAAVIKAEDPDIIALQEFFGEQRSTLDPLLKADYPYSVHCQGGKRANIGLYSKLPFAQSVDGACPENAYGTDRTAHIIGQFTLQNGTRFSVMTTHLDWPAPNFSRQAEQFSQVLDVVKSVKGPLILVGDFNSTPWSYALRGFADRAKMTRHVHANFTYPTLFVVAGAWRHTPPFLPLDQVMTRGDVAVHDLHVGADTGSDHLPVFVEFSVGQ